jgi:NAD(P)-dependent dehydrogenase (short-subunit alcohol dehydrogenase family)
MGQPQRFLNGQVCLVTGGAQGIGWAITQALADHGGEVYACDISTEYLAQAEAQLTNLPWGPHIHLAHCDVTDRSAFEQWIQGVVSETGRVDVLVHNATYLRWAPTAEQTIEQIEQTLQVNFNAMVYGIKTVLPRMLSDGGTIVTISSSMSQTIILPNAAPYAAAKAAIDVFTQTLQMECKGTPVHVALIRPATVAGTDFLRRRVLPSQMPRLLDFTPVATPLHIGDAVIRAIRNRKAVINIPRYLPLFHWLFLLVPGPFRWLVGVGGNARRNYNITWRYVPQYREQER